MKTEHVEAIVRFIRRIQPTDLVLPIGAALVSAGLQNLVERENRQRQRLAALDELVDVHRGALADAGVSLPADLAGDELHPLDIDGAVGIILARSPAEPDNRITDNPNPEKRPRRALRRLAVLGLAGGAGVTMWARGYARNYGQPATLAGFLAALSTRPDISSNSSDPNSSEPDDSSRSAVPCSHRYASDFDSVCESCGEKSRPSPAGPPAEGVIGHGEPPLEECGWSGCEWTSDATRSELSQRTAAAVHRNRCVHRPAGAVVPS